MVAKDENNQPARVPGLILENREQVRRFIEAKFRKELKQSYKNHARQIKVPADQAELETLLKGERCIFERKAIQ